MLGLPAFRSVSFTVLRFLGTFGTTLRYHRYLRFDFWSTFYILVVVSFYVLPFLSAFLRFLHFVLLCSPLFSFVHFSCYSFSFCSCSFSLRRILVGISTFVLYVYVFSIFWNLFSGCSLSWVENFTTGLLRFRSHTCSFILRLRSTHCPVHSTVPTYTTPCLHMISFHLFVSRFPVLSCSFILLHSFTFSVLRAISAFLVCHTGLFTFGLLYVRSGDFYDFLFVLLRSFRPVLCIPMEFLCVVLFWWYISFFHVHSFVFLFSHSIFWSVVSTAFLISCTTPPFFSPYFRYLESLWVVTVCSTFHTVTRSWNSCILYTFPFTFVGYLCCSRVHHTCSILYTTTVTVHAVLFSMFILFYTWVPRSRHCGVYCSFHTDVLHVLGVSFVSFVLPISISMWSLHRCVTPFLPFHSFLVLFVTVVSTVVLYSMHLRSFRRFRCLMGPGIRSLLFSHLLLLLECDWRCFSPLDVACWWCVLFTVLFFLICILHDWVRRCAVSRSTTKTGAVDFLRCSLHDFCTVPLFILLSASLTSPLHSSFLLFTHLSFFFSLPHHSHHVPFHGFTPG